MSDKVTVSRELMDELSRSSALETLHSEAEKALARINVEIVRATNELSGLTGQVSALQSERDGLQAEVAQLSAQRDSKKAEIAEQEKGYLAYCQKMDAQSAEKEAQAQNKIEVAEVVMKMLAEKKLAFQTERSNHLAGVTASKDEARELLQRVEALLRDLSSEEVPSGEESNPKGV